MDADRGEKGLSLRERIARVIYKQGGYCGLCEYDGWDTCSACTLTLFGYADAVLDDLGMREVGWRHPAMGRVHAHDARCDRQGCEPVYLIEQATHSGRTVTDDAR